MLAYVKGSLVFFPPNESVNTSGWQKSTISAAQNSLLTMFTAVPTGLLHGLAKGQVKGEGNHERSPKPCGLITTFQVSERWHGHGRSRNLKKEAPRQRRRAGRAERDQLSHHGAALASPGRKCPRKDRLELSPPSPRHVISRVEQ